MVCQNKFKAKHNDIQIQTVNFVLFDISLFVDYHVFFRKINLTVSLQKKEAIPDLAVN